MLSADKTSLESVLPNERKRWETPVVILASARRETLSNLNTVHQDVVLSTTSVGS